MRITANMALKNNSPPSSAPGGPFPKANSRPQSQNVRFSNRPILLQKSVDGY